MNISGIGFKPRYTYSISIFVDLNMDNRYTKGDFYNDVRLSVPFDKTKGSIVKLDGYVRIVE